MCKIKFEILENEIFDLNETSTDSNFLKCKILLVSNTFREVSDTSPIGPEQRKVRPYQTKKNKNASSKQKKMSTIKKNASK